MNRALYIAVFAIVALWLCACTPNSAFRTSGEITCKSGDAKSTACGTGFYETYDNYEIGFVEFSERGNDFNPANTQKTLDKLRAYKADGQRLAIIVFIHGWKHNAADDDGNVRSFKHSLSTLAKTKLMTNRKVVGIYVGWRGETLHGLGSENLTYWDRKSVAEEVGKGGVTELLLRLEHIDRDTTGYNSYYVVVGHSFGGAVTLTAMHDLLIARLVSAQHGDGIRSFGDGVILLNPAIEATQGLLLKENSHKLGQHGVDVPPLLYVISSDGDTATRLPFKLGQFIGTNLTWNQDVLSRSFNGSEYLLDEAELDTTTIGNFSPFHTGVLKDCNLATTKDGTTQCQGALETMTRRDGQVPLSLNTDVLGDWSFRSLCDANGGVPQSEKQIPCFPNEPIDFVYTSKSFINDHNDIFNEKITAFLATTVSKSIYFRNKEKYREQGRSSHYPECVNSAYEFTFGACFVRHLNDIQQASLNTAR